MRLFRVNIETLEALHKPFLAVILFDFDRIVVVRAETDSRRKDGSARMSGRAAAIGDITRRLTSRFEFDLKLQGD